MRRFRFRLEKLLELRRHTERQWEMKLAEATGACALIQKRISNIAEEMNAGRAERFSDPAHVSFENLYVNELYLQRLEEERKTKKIELERKMKEREEIKIVYLEHSKKRKVLDKLKEKKEAEYYKQQLNEDFKVADDITSNAHIRKNRSGTNDH
jgi:flagellar FliJ protein